MINLEALDIDELPSVKLVDRNNLPNTAGIYFAIDSQKTVQYIRENRS